MLVTGTEPHAHQLKELFYTHVIKLLGTKHFIMSAIYRFESINFVISALSPELLMFEIPAFFLVEPVLYDLYLKEKHSTNVI
jgi:hypothetical protein